MKTNCLTIFLLLSFPLLWGLACTPHIKQAQVDSNVKEQLTAEILEMDRKDQQYRWQLVFGETDMAIVDSLSKLPIAEKVKHFKKKVRQTTSWPMHSITPFKMPKTHWIKLIKPAFCRSTTPTVGPVKNWWERERALSLLWCFTFLIH